MVNKESAGTEPKSPSGDVAVFRDPLAKWVLLPIGWVLAILNLLGVTGDGWDRFILLPIVLFWSYAVWASYVMVSDKEIVVRRLGRPVRLPLERVVSVGKYQHGIWAGARVVGSIQLADGDRIQFPIGFFGYLLPPMWHKAALAEIALRARRGGRTLEISA